MFFNQYQCGTSPGFFGQAPGFPGVSTIPTYFPYATQSVFPTQYFPQAGYGFVPNPFAYTPTTGMFPTGFSSTPWPPYQAVQQPNLVQPLQVPAFPSWQSPFGQGPLQSGSAGETAPTSVTDLSAGRLSATDVDVIVPRASTPTAGKPKVQIVIPMAGAGQRFIDAGYTTPKPLITVSKGGSTKAMAKMVADNVSSSLIDARIIFVVQRKHYEAHGGAAAIAAAVPGCEIAFVEALTEGPACTVLVAEPLLDRTLPLFICNSDQFVEWDADAFYRRVLGLDGAAAPDAAILCFEHLQKETKWSYAAHGPDGRVTAVAEKVPISESATVGMYWFKTAGMFIDDAKAMIASNVRGPPSWYAHVCMCVYESRLRSISATIIITYAYLAEHIIGFGSYSIVVAGTCDFVSHVSDPSRTVLLCFTPHCS